MHKPSLFQRTTKLNNFAKEYYEIDKKVIYRFNTTLRSIINVQSLITVQGATFFYKKFKVSSGLGLFPFLRPKKSKFSHLEIYLVVLEQLKVL